MAGETGVGIGQRRRPKGTGSIQKLDAGRYRLRVFVGTDPVTGNPRQVTRAMPAKNETEARKTLVRLRDEVAAVEPSSSTATVRTLLEEWLAQSKARGRAPKTLHEARRSAETVIFPVLGDVPLRDLTARHLGEPYRTLTTGEGRAGPLKATSIRQHYAVLSAALGQAVRWGWLEQNPAARAQPPELGPANLQVPTPSEARVLLARARAESDRWGMLVVLAVLTGARRGSSSSGSGVTAARTGPLPPGSSWRPTALWSSPSPTPACRSTPTASPRPFTGCVESWEWLRSTCTPSGTSPPPSCWQGGSMPATRPRSSATPTRRSPWASTPTPPPNASPSTGPVAAPRPPGRRARRVRRCECHPRCCLSWTIRSTPVHWVSAMPPLGTGPRLQAGRSGRKR